MLINGFILAIALQPFMIQDACHTEQYGNGNKNCQHHANYSTSWDTMSYNSKETESVLWCVKLVKINQGDSNAMLGLLARMVHSKVLLLLSALKTMTNVSDNPRWAACSRGLCTRLSSNQKQLPWQSLATTHTDTAANCSLESLL